MPDFLEIFGLKKKSKKPTTTTTTPTTEPVGPLNPEKAMLLGVRHANLKQSAKEGHLSLNGDVDNRLKAAIDAMNRDEYDDAEQRLDQIEQELEVERQALAEAKRNYETELEEVNRLRTPLADQIKAGDFLARLQAIDLSISSAGTEASNWRYEAALVHVRQANTDCGTAKRDVEKAKKDYEDERGIVEDLLKDLKKHAQKAHVVGETDIADQKLVAAATAADLSKYVDARARVAEAKVKCEQGTGFADKFAEFVEKRAKAGAILQSCKGLAENAWNQSVGLLNAADGLAAPDVRNYAEANTRADNVLTYFKDLLTDAYVTKVAPKIQNLKDKIAGKPAKEFLDADVKQIDALQKQLVDNLAASKWSQVLFSAPRQIGRSITFCDKTADRRIVYDNQKTATLNTIKGLKDHKSLLGQMFSMNEMVAKTESLAERKTLRIEEAVEKLKEIDKNCSELLQVATDAEGYVDERVAADEKYTKLLTSKAYEGAAPHVATQIQAIDTLMLAAKKMTGNIDVKPGIVTMGDAGSQDWGGARKLVSQAVAEMNSVESLVASLKDVVAAQSLVKDATDAPKIKLAVEELRKQADVASKKAHADRAKDEFAEITKSLSEAERAAEANELSNAATPLATAAAQLAIAQTVQAEHARYLARFEPIDNRRKALLASKDPTPAKIQPKIDAIQELLTEATNQDNARAWEKVTVALGKADEAATEAELHARLRREFDARTADIELRRKALTDDPLKLAVSDVMAKAGSQAGELRFDNAKKLLDNAEARIKSASVKTLAATPDDVAFMDSANEMLSAEGGAALIDELVKNLPNTEAGFKAMVKLAKARFGIDIKSDANFKPEAIRRMWEMMAKVPQHTKDNPSLKNAERREPNKNGGFYQSDGSLMVMNGRPGRSNQKFGSQLNQLDPNIEEAYKPTNEDPVDLFDFATVHEVGHAVDDRMGFMNSRLGQETFGNWKQYGAAIEPIAKAVAKAKGYDSTPEQIEYVSEMILGNDPKVPPKAPEGKEAEWETARLKVVAWYAIATNGQVWWNQSDSAKIAIDGVVYQESYKRNWTSYSFAARAKGMTGYQFRAPGEWFAELYASYHCGKLKEGHPARKWLSSVSL